MKKPHYEKPVTEIKEVEAADIIVTSRDFEYGSNISDESDSSSASMSGAKRGKLKGRLQAQFDEHGNLTSYDSI